MLGCIVVTMGDKTRKEQTKQLLTDKEETKAEWVGKIVEEETKNEAAFVLTDKRLIASKGEGHFQDIGLQHIESVEAGTEEEAEIDFDNTDWGRVAIGVAVIALSALLMEISVILALVLSSVGVFPLILGIDINEQKHNKIVVNTDSSESARESMVIETDKNIGPDISRITQQSV